jgi:hypothetical protein
MQNLEIKDQFMDVTVVIPDLSYSHEVSQELTLEQRIAFLNLPISERRRILEEQAELMIAHYQENTEWKELMLGDVIDY